MRRNKDNLSLGLGMAAALFVASQAGAATITIGTSAPTAAIVASATDQSGTPTTSDFTDGNTGGIGQSFSVSAAGLVQSFTLLGAVSSSDVTTPPDTLTVRFGTIVFGFFNVSDTETGTITSVAGNATNGKYLTFTLATPQVVAPATGYGFSVSSFNGTTKTSTIGTARSATDIYTNGQAFAGPTFLPGYDRVFFVQTPEPASLGLLGAGTLGLLARRRRSV